MESKFLEVEITGIVNIIISSFQISTVKINCFVFIQIWIQCGKHNVLTKLRNILNRNVLGIDYEIYNLSNKVRYFINWNQSWHCWNLQTLLQVQSNWIVIFLLLVVNLMMNIKIYFNRVLEVFKPLTNCLVN